MIIPPFSTTGIGSLPHRDPAEACRLVLSACDIPFWPQLPKRSFLEGMISQYSEGMPFIRIDRRKETVRVGPDGGGEELERFYESWSEETAIAISAEYARGFHIFLEIIKARRFPFLKGHVTGPLTFTLGLQDMEGRPVYFDEELREVGLMLLKGKIRWQVNVLKQFADNAIIFLDEPIMSALGTSAYMAVTREESLRLLSEAVNAVKSSGGIAGIHSCGRAEWPLLYETGADIINFDAFDYAETLGIFPEEARAFIERGGIMALGMVPTTDAIKGATVDSIGDKYASAMKSLLSYLPKEKLFSQIMLTPSCGAGSRSVEEASKIFQLLLRIKEEALS